MAKNIANNNNAPNPINNFIRMLRRNKLLLIDLAVVVVALLMTVTEGVTLIFLFHLMFFILTLGAFYWGFRAFAFRATFWVSVTAILVFVKIYRDHVHADEFIELPLMTAILVLVFVIAGKRAKAEGALQKTNEELEDRVAKRTAELTGTNTELVHEVAERKEREKTMQKLSGVVEQTADFVIITDKEGVIEYVNPIFEKEIGFTKEEAIGQTPRILKSGQHPPETYKRLWKDILDGYVHREVIINKKKNGELFFEDKTITPLRDRHGSITHFVSTGQDITERMKAAEALRESEVKFRSLTETAAAAIFIYQNNQFRYVNPAAESITGYSQQELHSMNFWKIVHPDFQEFFPSPDSLPEQPRPVARRHEVKFLTRSNQEVWVDVTSGIIDFEGEPAVLGTAFDITLRKQVEKERERLLTTEHEQRLLAETLGEVFLALTAQTSYDSVLDEILRQTQRIISFSAANIMLLNDSILRIAHQQGYDNFDSKDIISNLEQSLADFPLDAQVVQTRQPLIVYNTHQNPHWVTTPEAGWIKSFIAVPICLQERVLGLLRLDSDRFNKFSAQDIERLQPLANAAAIALENVRLYEQAQLELAERIQTEKELRRVAARNQAILDAIPDTILHLNRQGHLLTYKVRDDNLAQGLVGTVRAGEDLSQMLPADLVEIMLHYINRTLNTGRVQIFEYQLFNKQAPQDFEAQLAVSGPDEVLVIFRDITERKARAAAVEQERSRIARDLHDLLGQNLGYLCLKLDKFTLVDSSAHGETIQPEIMQMRNVANKAYELVRNMLAAARPSNSADLARALLAQTKSVGTRAFFKVQLTSAGRVSPLSPVVQQQVLYIFHEALNNVEKHANAQAVNINVTWLEETLLITFSDDGCGFETDALQTEGHFGLMIMQERAEEINGHLSLTSNSGTGTKITLRVPLVPAAQVATE